MLSVWIQEYFLFFEGFFLHSMSASLAFNEVLSYFPIHLSPFLPWLFVSRRSVFHTCIPGLLSLYFILLRPPLL